MLDPRAESPHRRQAWDTQRRWLFGRRRHRSWHCQLTCGVKCHSFSVPHCFFMPHQGILLVDQHFEVRPWARTASLEGQHFFGQIEPIVEAHHATNTFLFPSSPNHLLVTVHRHHFRCMCCTELIPIRTAVTSPASPTLAINSTAQRNLHLRLSTSHNHLIALRALRRLRRHHHEIGHAFSGHATPQFRLLNVQARSLAHWIHLTGDAHLERHILGDWSQDLFSFHTGDWFSFHTADLFSLLHPGILVRKNWFPFGNLGIPGAGGGFSLDCRLLDCRLLACPLQRERPCLGLGALSRELGAAFRCGYAPWSPGIRIARNTGLSEQISHKTHGANA